MNICKVLRRNSVIIQFSDGSSLLRLCPIKKKKILIEVDIKSNAFWKSDLGFKNNVLTKDSYTDFKKLFSSR